MSQDTKQTLDAPAKKKNEGVMQAIKFALFSASAGLIQIVSFTILNEVVLNLGFFKNLMATNPGFASVMKNEYGPIYLIALILSVLWNFTFNRKFTFKSATNVPIAMAKVALFYAVFTPISTILGNYFTGEKHVNEYIVLGVTMLFNLTLEFVYDKYFVFREPKAAAEADDSKQAPVAATEHAKITAEHSADTFNAESAIDLEIDKMAEDISLKQRILEDSTTDEAVEDILDEAVADVIGESQD